MPKINIFVPIIGLAAIGIILQAPTIAEYMTDGSKLEARIEKCQTEVADPNNDSRCINASAAATRHWQAEINTVIADLNAKHAVVKSLIESCETPRCTAAVTKTPESQALEAATQAYQKLKAAKPPVWTASS